MNCERMGKRIALALARGIRVTYADAHQPKKLDVMVDDLMEMAMALDMESRDENWNIEDTKLARDVEILHAIQAELAVIKPEELEEL